MAQLPDNVLETLRELTQAVRDLDPPVVQGEDALNELPVGTIVVDEAGFPYLKVLTGKWAANGIVGQWDAVDVGRSPVKVIWRPRATEAV